MNTHVDPISTFTGEYRWLSNFYISPIEYEGLWYPSLEHAYQAAKSDDPDIRKEIALLLHPRDAKAMGNKITMRPFWDEVKRSVMVELIAHKFPLDKMHFLSQRLVETHPRELIEGNTWGDVFWGMDLNTAIGENHLGKILMERRNELIAYFNNESDSVHSVSA